MQNKYALQKYTGTASRHTCPACGRKRCFTRYIDETGEPLAETVGRCDHESSCGYHYTPRQYFQDHPEAKPASIHPVHPVHPRTPVDKVDTLPEDIVTRSVRPGCHSHLTRFLSTILDPLILENIIHDYRLGVTRDRSVIFFQIDTRGRIRTGKIMKYDPDTGHRIKDPGTPNKITWVHSLMKHTRQLPPDWTLTQCLFGEHLLTRHPDKPVGLVESEKTAVICAGLMPQFIWLATGGKSQLNERLHILRGRKVTAFPDADGYDTWQQKLSTLPQLDIKVSDLLQRYATPEDHAAHIDIADWLIRWQRSADPATDTTFAAIAQYISPEVHEEMKAMIHELGLEFLGVEQIQKEEDSPAQIE